MISKKNDFKIKLEENIFISFNQVQQRLGDGSYYMENLGIYPIEQNLINLIKYELNPVTIYEKKSSF